MTELRGAPCAAAITERCKEKIAELARRDIVPTLAIVRIGARSDDESYERGAEKRFASAGAEIKKFLLPEDVQQEELEALLCTLNEDPRIHGILLFRPLPPQIEEERIKHLIKAEKDVDGMSYAGLGGLFAGKKVTAGYAPCTPSAVIELFDFYGIDLTGKRAVVLGRSSVVGLPLAVLMIHRNATVTVCHTRTKDLKEACRNADILVAAVGKARMVTEEYLSEGQILIDVGINFCNGKMCGDIDADGAAKLASAATPVPGGVGAITTSVLLKHVVDSAEKLC